MKRAIPIMIGVVILCLFAGTLVFLYQKSQAKPVKFETVKPAKMTIVKKTVATGAIVPRKEVELKPRVSGILDKLSVEAGQAIKKGDPIATIKIVPNVVNLNDAESTVKTARINFENAKKELDRFRNLLAQNIVSETEFARYDLEYKLRQQELTAAQSNLQLIKSGAARGSDKVSNVVESTVDGMVIAVPVKEGESVTETNNFNPGTTIASVANMGDMIFQGKVDESEVGKIKEGMELDIVIGAIEELRFKGRLEYISPKGETVEGAIQFEIKAAIDLKPGTFIRAGYSANADIVLDRHENVLAIDEAVIQFDDKKQPFVEVAVAEQRFERRDVQVGLSDGVNIEVVKGLAQSDVVKKPQ
jgi:HlyD family secretion protein